MPVYIVMASPEGAQRYIDSIWTNHDAALDRAQHLERSMEAGRIMSPRIWIIEHQIEDAEPVEQPND